MAARIAALRSLTRSRSGNHVDMKQGARGEAQVHVDAPPEVVYGVVSDVKRMGEWSPETIKCDWIQARRALSSARVSRERTSAVS